MSLPAVSKYLHVLEPSGLITRSREAQWRPCHPKTKPLKETVDWLEHDRPLGRSASTNNKISNR